MVESSLKLKKMKTIMVMAVAAGTLWSAARYFKIDSLRDLKHFVRPAMKKLRLNKILG